MSKYFLETKSLRGKVKLELVLSNCATKAELKNATSVDTLKFAEKLDLSNLISNVDKLDIDKSKNVLTNLSNLKGKVNKLDADKLVPVPDDLSKLSHVVKNNVVKKDVYNAKIKYIEDKIPDATNLRSNTTFNAKINEVQGEISSITNLTTTSALNAKINEVKGKRPNITNLATTTDITAVDNKLKNVTSNKNEINELSKKVKAISTKGLTKDLINKFSILHEAKYFS